MARQTFGGDWTEDKLRRVGEYFERYNIALKNQPFSREYIDAFAGTGYREVRDVGSGKGLMFPGLAEPDVQGFLDGSARKALKVEPGFDRFTFIEKDPSKVQELEKLRDEFHAKDIRIECGDANERVQAICRESWNRRRAVLFLDPFGMQVSWKTLEAVARTKCIDVWLLFPLGVAISRLLRRDGEIEEPLRQRLNFIFGDESWFDAFYQEPAPNKSGQRRLFDDIPEPDYPWKADFSVIEDYFRMRLRSIFAGVAENSVRLKNSKNIPLYLLFFMAGNKKGARIAVRIAESIMSKP